MFKKVSAYVRARLAMVFAVSLAHVSTMFKKLSAYVVAALAMVFAVSPAHATTIYDSMVAGVVFTDLQTALLAIALNVVSFLVVIVGIKYIYRIIKKT